MNRILRRITTLILMFAPCLSPFFMEVARGQSRETGLVLPSKRTLDKLGLERGWWGQATMNPSRDHIRYITADEQVLFVQSTAGVVTAFDAENGRKLWALQLGRLDQFSLPVATNEKLALVVVGLTMYCVEKLSGKLLWEMSLPAAPSTSPTLDKSRIYVGTLDGSVYAFNIRRIGFLYTEGRLPQWSYQAVDWRYKTSREITSPPVSNERVVAFASLDKSLYSVTADQRKLNYQIETDAAISAPLAVSEGYLFLASEDFNFYCINGENGRVRWQFVSGLPVKRQPRVIGTQVYLTPERGGIFCLSRSVGNRIWWSPKAEHFIAASAESIYGWDGIDQLVILARKDGAPRGALRMPQFVRHVNNDRTDRIYLASESGLVICLREKANEQPLFHMFPERKPISPDFAPDGAKTTPAAPATTTPSDTKPPENDDNNDSE